MTPLKATVAIKAIKCKSFLFDGCLNVWYQKEKKRKITKVNHEIGMRIS